MELMKNIGENMAGASLCGHGQLGWNPVQSALRYFPEDFASHLDDKKCPTGQCLGPAYTPQRTRSRWVSAQPLEIKI
jgi:hypothetical protein